MHKNEIIESKSLPNSKPEKKRHMSSLLESKSLTDSKPEKKGYMSSLRNILIKDDSRFSSNTKDLFEQKIKLKIKPSERDDRMDKERSVSNQPKEKEKKETGS